MIIRFVTAPPIATPACLRMTCSAVTERTHIFTVRRIQRSSASHPEIMDVQLQKLAKPNPCSTIDKRKN
ncbi:Related to neomycin resistance protein NEO1 [Trichuris trichiura]|uniref:Related to neomycin resistance protein NEO1 n=1 Tax=Trichuris trichiura TaxID=36087 RepID=A0A077ZH56_TRITR|nr:Related to neomycin resistance protein NEO1 [Trichuris trichiura]